VQVEAEITRLQWLWQRGAGAALAPPVAVPERLAAAPAVAVAASELELAQELVPLLGEAALAELDYFEQLQLASVLRVCRGAASLSQAGRQLFNISRQRRSVSNDADRLRKYLARFGLRWEQL